MNPTQVALQTMLLAAAVAVFLTACSPGPPPSEDSIPLYQRRYDMLHPTQP